MATVVEGNFTAATQVSSEFTINKPLHDQARFELNILLGGSTTGTLILEAQVLGNWVQVVSKTASGVTGISRSSTKLFRLRCSVYSGSNGIRYGIYN